MATSAALTNSDILSLVSECITLPPLYSLVDSAEARADLARAALVCVAFHEPATRLLWKDLTGLVPLLNLLPSSLTKMTAVGETMFWDTYVSMLYSYITRDIGLEKQLRKDVQCETWVNRPRTMLSSSIRRCTVISFGPCSNGYSRHAKLHE